MTVNLASYPKCRYRLNVSGANLKDPLMTPYWCAVSVSAGLDDELLTAFGGFDFDDKSDANGWRLLARLEVFLRLREKLFKQIMANGRKAA